jgi:hypothetical protein
MLMTAEAGLPWILLAGGRVAEALSGFGKMLIAASVTTSGFG